MVIYYSSNSILIYLSSFISCHPLKYAKFQPKINIHYASTHLTSSSPLLWSYYFTSANVCQSAHLKISHHSPRTYSNTTSSVILPLNTPKHEQSNLSSTLLQFYIIFIYFICNTYEILITQDLILELDLALPSTSS